MKNKIVSLLSAFVLLPAGFGSTVAPIAAQASPVATVASAPAKLAGVANFWNLPSQTGLLYQHDGADRPGCVSLGGNGNLTSSIYNGTGHKIRLYDAGNCLAAPYLDVANGYQGTLSQYGFDNKASAFYIY